MISTAKSHNSTTSKSYVRLGTVSLLGALLMFTACLEPPTEGSEDGLWDTPGSDEAEVAADDSVIATISLENGTRVEFVQVGPGQLVASTLADSQEAIDEVSALGRNASAVELYEALVEEPAPQALVDAVRRLEKRLEAAGELEAFPVESNTSALNDAPQQYPTSSTHLTCGSSCGWWNCMYDLSGGNSYTGVTRVAASAIYASGGNAYHSINAHGVNFKGATVPQGQYGYLQSWHDWATFTWYASGPLYDWQITSCWW